MLVTGTTVAVALIWLSRHISWFKTTNIHIKAPDSKLFADGRYDKLRILNKCSLFWITYQRLLFPCVLHKGYVNIGSGYWMMSWRLICDKPLTKIIDRKVSDIRSQNGHVISCCTHLCIYKFTGCITIQWLLVSTLICILFIEEAIHIIFQ